MNGLKDILERLKIEQLNPMQEASVEAFDKGGEDLILLSPTGSGKTLAFLLPLVGSLKADVKGVQAVVLVPSRELALQIEQVFKAMGTEFKAMSCYGGRPAMEEHRTMKGMQPAVIIGTPGRMNDHLSKQNFDASTVSLLVIDEFDKCLEFGFQEEMATAERKATELANQTIDLIFPGEQQPESDHGIQYEQAETGTNKDRHFRRAKGWFGYQLKVKEEASRILITIRKDDRNKVAILLNNEKLAVHPTISEADKDGFITLSYVLPQKLNTGSCPIRFIPDGTEWTSAVYEVRLLK